MAKRAPVDEKPFRPLDVSLLNSVVQHTPAASASEPVPRPAPMPVHRESPRPGVVMVPALEKLESERRILFSRQESQALDRLINNLAWRLRAQVKVSHLIRALVGLVIRAERQVDQRAAERGPLVRPPNSDLAAIAKFEDDLAAILENALRDAGAL